LDLRLLLDSTETASFRKRRPESLEAYAIIVTFGLRTNGIAMRRFPVPYR